MENFAQHLALKDVRLRTVQSYYRQIRLVAEHFGRDPKRLSQKSIQGYILHLKEGKGWSPSSIRQGIAACRMFPFVVPAVALGDDGRLRRPKSPKWLARGEVFAARLRTLLLQAIRREGLLDEKEIQDLWKIGWNCDVENFGSGENALKYLGAYVYPDVAKFPEVRLARLEPKPCRERSNLRDPAACSENAATASLWNLG